MKYFIITVLLFMPFTMSHAREVVKDEGINSYTTSPTKVRCIKDKIVLYLKFAGEIEKAVDAQKFIGKQENQVVEMAAKIGITDVKIISYYMSISFNKNKYEDKNKYNYSGHIRLKVSSVDHHKALLLFEGLKNHQYQSGSLDMHGTPRSNCK